MALYGTAFDALVPPGTVSGVPPAGRGRSRRVAEATVRPKRGKAREPKERRPRQP